jgi:thiosulfate/3-mercaptopyruvate sulfurtransferase
VTYRFADCRYDLLDSAAGERRYLEGHVPGAAFLDLDRDLSDLSRAPAEGRHPLPAADTFAAAASRAGIGPGVFVVAYDQGMTGGAARLWWLLRHFGHEDVAVLDGGIGVWRGPLRSGHEQIEPASFVSHPRDGDTVEADELLARLGDPALALVDARAAERFRGDVEPLDPVAGHIPGAVNAPLGQGLSPSVLEASEIVAYCGSGVVACVALLELARAGRPDAKLYAGSWSEWSRRGLPVESAPAGSGR